MELNEESPEYVNNRQAKYMRRQCSVKDDFHPMRTNNKKTLLIRSKSASNIFDPHSQYHTEEDDSSLESTSTEYSSHIPAPVEKDLFQAGGHGGVSREEGGKIRKKTTKSEIKYYNHLKETLDIPDSIKQLCPKYYGKKKEVHRHKTDHYIILEDLTADMEKPCIMDIKMGTVTAGKDANFVKKHVVLKKDKETTSFQQGLRIVGARIYMKDTDTYRIIGRSDGYNITAEQLPAFISGFLYNGVDFHSCLLKFYISQLQKIQEWMNEQCKYRFYSSSILFVYDGNGSPKKNFKADIRMIDFAHVIKTDDRKLDYGYLIGINNLLNFLESFVDFTIDTYKTYLLKIFPFNNGNFPEFTKSPKTTKISNPKIFSKKKEKSPIKRWQNLLSFTIQ